MIKRAMMALECKKISDIALLFKISPQNLNGYIDRETFIDLIEPELYKRDISVEWVKTGQGKMMLEYGKVAEQNKSYAGYDVTPPKISDLLSKTASILESQSTYSIALKSNIIAFHHAVTCEEQLDMANKRIDTLEEHVKSIESRLPPKTINGG